MTGRAMAMGRIYPGVYVLRAPRRVRMPWCMCEDCDPERKLAMGEDILYSATGARVVWPIGLWPVGSIDAWRGYP